MGPLLALILLYFSPVSAILEHRPDWIYVCSIQREDFQQCTTEAVQRLFNELPKGVPSIGIEPLDPLFVPSVTILQGGGPVSVNASLYNVTVRGFGHSKILSNVIDTENYDFFTKLRLPTLRIDGNYNLLGRILVIPLRGRGKCWFEASDLDIFVKSDVDLYEKQGHKFYNISGVHVQFTIGGLKFYMGNLFDGIKALEETTNAYLNQNWRPVADSLYPVLVKTIEDLMLDILQKIFHKIPADFWVPEFLDRKTPSS